MSVEKVFRAHDKVSSLGLVRVLSENRFQCLEVKGKWSNHFVTEALWPNCPLATTLAVVAITNSISLTLT